MKSPAPGRNRRSAGRLGLAAALLVVALFFAWARSRSAELERRLAALRAQGVPVTPADWAARLPPVPDSENAGKLALDAASRFRDVEGLVMPEQSQTRSSTPGARSTEAAKAARAYLEANAHVLEGIDSALRWPHTRYSDLAARPVRLFDHQDWIQAFRRLDLCAELAATAAQPEVAARCLRDALRMACTADQEPGLPSTIVACAARREAAKAAERVLALTGLPGGELERLQSEFGAAADSMSLDRGFDGERVLDLWLLRDSTSLLLDDLPLGKRLPMRLYVAGSFRSRDLLAMLDFFDDLHRTANLPPQARAVGLQRASDSLRQRIQRQHLPLAEKLQLRLQGVLWDYVGALTRLRCAQTACAVELWRLAHGGAPPPSLEALGPAFLATAPTDPMDGKPLRFRVRPKGYVVYGIGENGRDDGGEGSVPGLSSDPDITFTVDR